MLTKPDTTQIDARIKELFPDGLLERGARYERWLVYPEIKDQQFIDHVTRTLEPLGTFTGQVMGKSMTVFFFCDWFANSPPNDILRR